MKLLILVTHLLGTGHLARALVLGRAFRAAGHRVTLVSGGMPVAHLDASGVDVVQLPPLRSDGVNFARLLDEHGETASDALKAARQSKVRTVFDTVHPDVILTELFPFGRRVLAAEFTAMLEAAKARATAPLICCSIRDILAPPSKPAKAEATDRIITDFYDAVLVHSDPALTPLEASWPVTPAMARKLHYTGFVTPPPSEPHPQALGRGEILVSAGGGDVGAPLYRAAVDAARLDASLRWRILIGGGAAETQGAALAQNAPANLVIEPARPDFRQMLHHATASISLCGYNTALDILQSGTPAVFIPFDEGGETEQSLRATALAALDGVNVLRASDLSGEQLLETVRATLLAPPRAPRRAGLCGATRSVAIIEGLFEKARHAG